MLIRDNSRREIPQYVRAYGLDGIQVPIQQRALHTVRICPTINE